MEQKYRKLEMGDTIQDGDEVWGFGLGPWGPVLRSKFGQPYRNGYYEMRRPVTEEQKKFCCPPICIGPFIIKTLAEKGVWQSDGGNALIAADGLFGKDPYKELNELNEVREAWQKDHMEMRQQLESMTKSWYDQRADLADAKNQIVDLTRRLEDALSDKVIALSDKVIAEKRLKNIERHVQEEHVASWKRIQGVLPESSEDSRSSLVDDIIWHIQNLEKRIANHHKEAERLSVENEQLCAANYQLNIIKQAFEFLSRG